MRYSAVLLLIVLGLMLFSESQCKNPSHQASVTPVSSDTQSYRTVKYLALGDSYTIGESVNYKDNYPNQLKDSLKLYNVLVDGQVKIIARTGWTTDELQSAIDNEKLQDSFDLVTLLIGVNNQYRGYDTAVYIKEFEELLLKSIYFAKNDTNHVFVLSIPDYGYTPFGKKNQVKISRELDQYNAIAKSICLKYKVQFFDITPISRLAQAQPDLVAPDGLHPSAIMYSQWVKLICKDIAYRFSH